MVNAMNEGRNVCLNNERNLRECLDSYNRKENVVSRDRNHERTGANLPSQLARRCEAIK
jgi:hypothetical protein